MPYAVHETAVVFVDADSQALFHYADEVVRRISPPVPNAPSPRFVAPAFSPDGRFVYCVRERDLPGGTVHDLVRVSTAEPEMLVVAAGRDFYGAPAVHPDGRALAWVSWDFPHMPWDQSRLWEVALSDDGALAPPVLVAGSPDESITQPCYSPDGRLHYVSDRTGWWNLYARTHDGRDVPVLDEAAEYGRPDWFTGQRTYGFLGACEVVAAVTRSGLDQVVLVRSGPMETGSVRTLPAPVEAVEFLDTSAPDAMVVLAGAPDLPWSVIRLDIGGEARVIRTSWPDAPTAPAISTPRAVVADGSDGAPVHALLYPPAHVDRNDPVGAPPVIVWCHGGPTVLVRTTLDVDVQFWTARGYAVLVVNYRGSPGFGRAYRQEIQHRWGVLDVGDCLAAVRHAVSAGDVDPERVVVRGKSSGGLTALRSMALAAQLGVTVAAAVVISGVTDPEQLREATHKMESRYLDGLIGPWPQAASTYRDRGIFSQLSALAALAAPVLLVHGTNDRIVPYDQAVRLRDALVARGVEAHLETIPDEGHIHQPEIIGRIARAEEEFLARVLTRTTPSSEE